MAEAILDLCLDTVQPNRVRLVYGVQNDYNSRYICARFTVNGKPIDIEGTAAVRINAKRPDGKKDAFPGTVNTDGTVKVPVAQWMLEVPGEVSASVTAITSNSALTTQDFYIMAKPSNWDGTGAPSEEDPDKDVIQTIIVSENERVEAEKQRAETFAEMEERFSHWDDSIAPSASVTQTAEGANIRLKDKNGGTTATVKSAYGSAKEGGYTGTESEFSEDINPDNIKAEANNYIATELAKRGQLKPEFANSVDELKESGDTSKLYVLPDGYIYAYMKKKQTIPHNANDGTCAINKYISYKVNMDGALTSNNGSVVTSPIAVDNSITNYKLTVSGLEKLIPRNYVALQVLYYTADGTPIEQLGAKQLGLTTSNEIDLPLPVTANIAVDKHPKNGTVIWSNTAYIRINLGISTNSITDANIANLVINLEPLNQNTYDYGWYSTGHMFNTDDYGQAIEKNIADIEDLNKRLTETEKKLEDGSFNTGTGGETTPLFNKLGLIGDSLTNQEYQGWQALVVNMLNIPEWHKNAITGSTVARYADTTLTPFVERYLDTPEDCDCIVIMGGTNDSAKNGENMGEVGVLNNNTFKGAYSTIVEGLLERKPSTRIMLMTPPRSYSYSFAEYTRIRLYADATKDVALHYGLPCLDLYNTLGWNAKTAEWCSWDWANNDNVHFSRDIGPRVGRMVANFIRNNY